MKCPKCGCDMEMDEEYSEEDSSGEGEAEMEGGDEELSEEDKNDLLAALDDHSIPASNIREAMKKRGYKLNIDVIGRYRRGELVTDIRESV